MKLLRVDNMYLARLLFFSYFYVEFCWTLLPRIIGIFSSCNHLKYDEETVKASIYQNLSKFMFEQDCILPVTEHRLCENYTQRVSYEAYDVCFDRQILLEVVLNMTLDKKYQSQSTVNPIIMVLTYTSNTLFTLLGSLLNTPHWKFTSVIIFNTSYEVSYPLTEMGYQQMHDSSPLLELIQEYEWDSIAVILVTKGNDFALDLEMRDSFIENLRSTTICYYSHTVHVNDEEQLQGIARKIRFERKYKEPLILFGGRKAQMKLVKAVEDDFTRRIKHIWVMHDIL